MPAVSRDARRRDHAAPLRVIREMSERLIRTSRAVITTATAVAVVGLLVATLALAATTASDPTPAPAHPTPAAQHTAPSERTIAFLSDLVPPPGAAILLIAGIVAVARRR